MTFSHKAKYKPHLWAYNRSSCLVPFGDPVVSDELLTRKLFPYTYDLTGELLWPALG